MRGGGKEGWKEGENGGRRGGRRLRMEGGNGRVILYSAILYNIYQSV